MRRDPNPPSLHRAGLDAPAVAVAADSVGVADSAAAVRDQHTAAAAAAVVRNPVAVAAARSHWVADVADVAGGDRGNYGLVVADHPPEEEEGWWDAAEVDSLGEEAEVGWLEVAVVHHWRVAAVD